MPGMLSEAQGVPPQGAPTPSSGPGPQTPPTESPGAGTPPLDGASGPGQPPAGPEAMATGSFEELRDQGIQRLYGENFDGMIQMFQTNGAENFPKAMAIAVNSTIEYLEKENGKLPPEMAAEVGMDVMMKLLEDIIGGGVVPDVTLEQVQQAFPAILVMYADSRPDVSKEDIQALVQEVQKGVAQQEGGAPAEAAPPDPNAPLSTGPGPEPSGSPVPPGVTV